MGTSTSALTCPWTAALLPPLGCPLCGSLEDLGVAREPSVTRLWPSMATLTCPLEISLGKRWHPALREARTSQPSWRAVSWCPSPPCWTSWPRPCSRNLVAPRDSRLMVIHVKLLRERSLRKLLLLASTSSTSRCLMRP